jgi:hypothetical protein
MRYLFSIICVCVAFSCNKSNDPTPSENSDVYVAGYGFNANRILVAKYWKNGEVIDLTDGSANAASAGITVGANNVYVCGWDSGSPSVLNDGKYWMNGKELEIGNGCIGTVSVTTNGSDFYLLGIDATGWNYWKNNGAVSLTDTSSIQTTDIAVNGNDVFVSGYTEPPYLINNHQALCWKNGQLIYRSPVQSIAKGVISTGTDVYLVGYLLGNDAQHTTAAYWKNGVLQNLTDGTSAAKGYSIAQAGSDIYVAGAENSVAKYWKNGVAVNLTDGTTQAEAFSIAIKGTDIYVAGYEGNNARYWKNGVSQPFSDGSLNNVAVDIFVK